MEVGNYKKTMFWYYDWLKKGSIVLRFTKQIIMEADVDAQVTVLLQSVEGRS